MYSETFIGIIFKSYLLIKVKRGWLADLVLNVGDLLQLTKKENYLYFTNFLYGWKEMTMEDHFILSRRGGLAPK